MELRQLNYFKTVCEYKNFSRAAKELYVSPSTLTAAINKLEEECNVELIIRNNHNFVLTSYGELLYATAEEILEKVSAFKTALVPDENKNDKIRIGTAIPLSSMRLLENINLFKKEHANLDIEIIRHTGGNICGMVNSHTLDCGIVLSRHLNIRDLEYVKYEDMEYGLYVSKSHKWAKLKVVTPSMLKKDNCLKIINAKGGLKYAIDKYFSRFNITVEKGNFTNGIIENTLRFIERNTGVAILPKDCIYESKNTVFIPFDPPLIVEYMFVWNKSFPLKDGAQNLIKYLFNNPFNE